MTRQERSAELRVVVVGAGKVGRAVASQLVGGARAMCSRNGVVMRLIGMADRSAMLLDTRGLPEASIRGALDVKQSGMQLDSLSTHVGTLDLDMLGRLALPGVVFVDTTADPDIGGMWRAALDAGAYVALANKLPLCRSWAESGVFFEHPRLRYEATVGAGLPVISTLRRLLDSGDCIKRIRASVSGTLAYLMHSASSGVPLSEAVAAAINAGYAEPDPREDLRGADVARKAMILTRTLGWPVEREDVDAESLYPQRLDGCDLSTFLQELPALDAGFAARVSAAAEQGDVLRYAASINPGERSIRVALQPFERSDPFACCAGTENRIEFHTERYARDILSVSGPGAGPQVTAMGVLSDLVELAGEVRRGGCHE